MLTLKDGRTELWQWDTAREISVDKECSQIHFSNKVFGRSIDVNVVDGVAKIPDVPLQTDKDLMVWAFVGTSENGFTKISKTFKINHRNKPADYVFTPPEQTSLEEIKERIEHLESIGGVGEDGFSPIVTVTQTDTGATISIQDKDGTTTATITNGKDGKDGSDAEVTDENIKTALGYTPADQKGVDKLSEEIVNLKTTITLGQHTDGLIYIFIGGVPVGDGLSISGGGIVEPVYGQPLTDSSMLKMAQQTTAILGVKLDTEPTQKQTISVLADSNVVAFDKEVLEFTPENWNEYQFVTVTAGMIDKDTSVNIILRNSDELLTDTNITVYISADSYSVDTTIPAENQHILTSADFEAVTAVQGYGIICKKYIEEHTNIKVPATMEYNGVTYSPVYVAGNSSGTAGYTFGDNTVIEYVEFDEGVSVLNGQNSFSNTKDMIGLFYGCTNLKGVKFNGTIETKSISKAFYNCSSLKFVDGIQTLDLSNSYSAMQSAFEGCTSLEYMQDLSGIKTNRTNDPTDAVKMFMGCTSLKKVYGLPQLTNMQNAFSGCTSLEEAVVPSTVGTYGTTTNAAYANFCFNGCVNLKKLTVLSEVATPGLPSTLNNDCVIYAIEGSSVYTALQSAIASLPTATLLPYGSESESGNFVVAWGDSTTSYNANWIDWVQRLGDKLDGFTMKNQAVSGEYTTSTSARQGGNDLKVGAFTIPSDTTATPITLTTEDGHAFGTNPVFSAGASFNPCTIAGVKGSIANAGSGNYTFTRMDAGESVEVEANTTVVSAVDTVFNNENSVMLINLGTNSGWDENADVLLNQVQLMIDHFTELGGTKYIVCGLSSGKHLRSESLRQVAFEYEQKASTAFGEHWLNMREYLIQNGLTENGLTASALDNERMALGQVPASLLGGGSTTDIKMFDGVNVTDETHFNAYGANSQANAFYSKGVALGYWS